MLWNLLTTTGFIIAGLLFYRFWPAILLRLKRFDDDNHARIESERRDRGDSLAHFRHTLRVAGEQVDDVTEVEVTDIRTGTPVKRFLFEGERYATRHDAEHAREGKVRALARAYYMDLPTALSARKGDDKLGKN